MAPVFRPRWRLCGAALLLVLPWAAAADDLQFDRPGIPFSPSTLGRGGFAWEQGLPDVSWERSDGGIQREYDAGTVLRLGLSDRLELQLSSDTQVWRRDTGPDALRGHGAGSTTLAAKVVLPSSRESFAWALLAQADLDSGSRTYGSDDHLRSIALTGEWTLPQDRALALYAQLADSRAGHSWTFAPNYTFVSGEHWQAYVEAGIGHGPDSTRAAGAGMAWMLGQHAQLDVSLLRGTAADAPDWQGGLGLSIGFQ